ncbi:MAG: hypothetical protein M1828_004342 [Chrysothrix sp. TS-e1954]|nr:MAG: hypothetical protein M1828_004342 [Chrysothrix sp. TS-e1954]
MFQRLRNTIDGFAEEQQARQKPQTRSPSRKTTPIGRLQSPAQRAQVQRSADSGAGDNSELGYRDPEPSTFDPEFVVGSNNTSRSNTPVPLLQDPEVKIQDDDHGVRSKKPGDNTTVEEKTSEAEGADSELSSEVKSKLRRLNKLESKYQELLKAYRKAHARNASIEPFEARLRERTPLTSIGDASAFTEYVDQLNLRNDMVMDELKNLSNEKEAMNRQLDEAKQETRAALDEIAGLKEGKNRLGATLSHDPTVLSAIQFESVENRQLDQDVDMFSIDAEMPKLQAELELKDEQIERLQADNARLGTELSSAKESAEHMMQDLERKQVDLESMVTLHRSAGPQENEHEQSLHTVQRELEDSRLKLANAERRLQEVEHTRLDMETEPKSAQQQQSLELESRKVEAGHTNSALEVHNATEETTGRSKRNKRKKKKGTAIADNATVLSKPSTNIADLPQKDAPNATSVTAVRSELASCMRQLGEKSSTVDRLQEQVRNLEERLEEVDSLREEIVTLGQEHVQTKDALKNAEGERHRLATLLKEARDSLETTQDSRETLDAAMTISTQEALKVKTDLQSLQNQAKSMQTDLNAAQQLASTRYKEIVSLRETLQKSRPEVAALKSEMSEMRALNEELSAKSVEFGNLETREANVRSEMERLKEDMSDKTAEVRVLKEKLELEKSHRASLEDASHESEKALKRGRSERDEATASKASVSKKLEHSESEVSRLRKKLSELEKQLETLTRDAAALQDEISLKSAQHSSAQGLMSVARDQTSEIAAQLKETRERAESLEDELTDAHRLMTERGREGETMRRLLTEIDARAENRISEVKERLDVAVQERDRAEEEATATTRRKGRELDDAKHKLRDAERDRRQLTDEKDELIRAQRQLKDQTEAEQQRMKRSEQEMQETKSAMTSLRDALEEYERQTRDLDQQKGELRQTLDDTKRKLERLQTSNKTISDELRSLRSTRVRPVDSGGPSSRSSIDSLAVRITSPISAGRISPKMNLPSGSTQSNGSNVDYVYLKNVLLQFLEQRDKKHQAQLVPVLGMLLHFDRKDEQKWMTVINTR